MKQSNQHLKQMYQEKSTKELMQLINNHLEQGKDDHCLEYQIWNELLQERLPDTETYSYLWELYYQAA